MGSKGKKSDIGVGEEVKIATALMLQQFRLSEDQKELEFPSSLTSNERAFVHSIAQKAGLKSKSRGKGANRFLTVYKKDGSTIVQADAVFQLVRGSRQNIVTLLHRFQVTNKERQDLVPLSERDRLLIDEARGITHIVGRLSSYTPLVAPHRPPNEFSPIRESLPVFAQREEIISVIEQHQVVLITGEAGCGKTTQIPQYILENSAAKSKSCRIICTQPRRVAAVTIAERVAAERDEKVGHTVGFHVRLENKVSPLKTLLLFCTNGVLLSTLMGGDAILATVTHIIVDEVHERDRFSDFLLILLRDALVKFKNLKLVLMSAAIDLQLFLKYFNGCPVVSIPGKTFEVQELFLEDVLKCTGYKTKAMQKFQQELKKRQNQKKRLSSLCSSDGSDLGGNLSLGMSLSEEDELTRTGSSIKTTDDEISGDSNSSSNSEMDKCIMEAWENGSDDSFAQILYYIMSEHVSVDYQHSDLGVTVLMISSGRGNQMVVEQLLSLGANVDIRASNDWTALDWARNYNKNEVVEILEAHIAACETNYSNMSELLNESTEVQEIALEDKMLLDAYHHCFDDERVDIDLIICLLHKIITCQEEGGVLIFLPGYDEIITLRDRIMCDDKRFADVAKYSLFVLHSSMYTFDQKRVFAPSPPGIRKIILATNIAETSVTFNDVVFVIDSGKVKEKSFDCLTNTSSLRSVWISRSSSAQRRGRAGRCRNGVCYHLFSRIRLRNMQEYQQPEILRVPLQDLCLHTKLVAPPNTPIADFLARAPDPPPFMVTRNAVQLLKTIDALDPWEGLTELGHHLLDLPIDPRLGKMVLYAVVLKCLDPILTIACTLSYRDPFTLPTRAADKMNAILNKKRFSAATHSDHMTLLRVFHAWQKSTNEGRERIFCDKNFVSAPTMEMIGGIRTQLLGQLRASGFVRSRGGGDIRDLNSNSENWAVVKAALVAGTYPNLIRVDRERMQLITQKESKVRCHPSSVLIEMPQGPNISVSAAHTQAVEKLPSDWLIYDEMTRSEHVAYARCCTLVSPITVALFAGPSRLPLDAISEADNSVHGEGYEDNNSDSEFEEKSEGQKAMLKLDDWVAFRVDSEAAHLALQLRQKWHSLFLRRLRAPAKPWSQVDEAVVRTIVHVLSAEEQALGLTQPQGVGQRPRPMGTDFLCSSSNFLSMATVRRNSVETENSDCDSSLAGGDSPLAPRLSSQSRKITVSVSPKSRDTGCHSGTSAKGADERSDSSSVRSSGSACGSSPISPCHSPVSVDVTFTGASAVCNSSSGNDGRSQPKYFVIKGSSQKVIEVSLCRGVWVFTTPVERKLHKCLQDGKVVYLVFSVQGSGHFQGYARLTSEIVSEKVPEFSMPNSGNTYRIDWVKRANMPFQSTRHLQNPWNENRKVQISRDGQELEPSVGEALCKLWEKVPNFVPKSNQHSSGEHSIRTGNGENHYDSTSSSFHHHHHGSGYRGASQQQQQQASFTGRPIRGYQHHQQTGSNSAPSGGVGSASSGSFGNVSRHSGSGAPFAPWSQHK